jgi:hypothetical protein
MKQPSRTLAVNQSLSLVTSTIAIWVVLGACGGTEQEFEVESERSPMMMEGGGASCMAGYFVDASGRATCYDLAGAGSGSSAMPSYVRDYGACDNWHRSSRCWGADCVYRDRWYMAETCNGQSIYEVGSCVYLGRFGNLKVYRCKTRSGSTIKVYKRS